MAKIDCIEDIVAELSGYMFPSGVTEPKTIIVSAGSLSAYQSATNWSAYADLMVEASS